MKYPTPNQPSTRRLWSRPCWRAGAHTLSRWRVRSPRVARARNSRPWLKWQLSAFDSSPVAARACRARPSCAERQVTREFDSLQHCEDDALTRSGVDERRRAQQSASACRTRALSEELMVIRDIELVRLTGCPLHFISCVVGPCVAALPASPASSPHPDEGARSRIFRCSAAALASVEDVWPRA